METTKSERIKIGAFMLICGVLVIAFLGYVLNRYLTKEYNHYYTIFTGSVIGLYNEAKVKLNGIDVGNVTSIQIDPSDLEQVVVTFKVAKGTPIKLGTRAGLTHGISLTGEKQVVLSGGRFDEPDVENLGYVPAEASAFDQFANQAGGIVEKVDLLLTNFNQIFSKQNAQSISNALKNFETSTENLNQVTKNLVEPIENIKSSAQSMQKILAEIEEAKIAAKTGENLDILKQKLENIDTQNLNENLNTTIKTALQLINRLDQAVYKNQDQVENAILELNAVLENLEEFSQKIKNNPSLLIRSESKKGRK